MSDSVQSHRWQPTRLPCPWDSPGKNTGVGCHFLLQCMKWKVKVKSLSRVPTLCDPKDCSLPDSSVHGIFQARVLEWGATAFSTWLLDNKPIPVVYPVIFQPILWGTGGTRGKDTNGLEFWQSGRHWLEVAWISGWMLRTNFSHCILIAQERKNVLYNLIFH